MNAADRSRVTRDCENGSVDPVCVLPIFRIAVWRPRMIKVSVMYPNSPGARFDHEYYRDKHMPLLKARMGSSCKYYTVDKGLAGGTPGVPATYVAMCHF